MAGIVGARELKNRLGRYLRQVRDGTVLVITDRGVPVAELRPLPREDSEVDERLGKLVAAGLLAPRSRAGLEERSPVPVAGGDLSDAIVRDREDRL